MDARQNIYIIGAQCTGKTTLVNALAAHYARQQDADQPAVIREVARSVLTRDGFTRQDIETSPMRAMQLQAAILAAQHKAEATILEGTRATWYISDRSGLDPLAYASTFVDREAVDTLLATSDWQRLETSMKSGLVVLCEAGCEWLVDDGTRLMPKSNEEWDRIHVAFQSLLAEREIRFVMLSRNIRSVEDRVAFVTSHHEQDRGVVERSRD